MKDLNYQTGKIGEQIAKELLIKKGYRILQSNFRTRFGEIDLVAAKNKKLVFVEVKLKVGEDYGLPEEMINKAKLAQIKKMAEVFLQSNQQIIKNYSSFQIDAICIVFDQNKMSKRISHWENIGDEMD